MIRENENKKYDLSYIYILYVYIYKIKKQIKSIGLKPQLKGKFNFITFIIKYIMYTLN